MSSSQASCLEGRREEGVSLAGVASLEGRREEGVSLVGDASFEGLREEGVCLEGRREEGASSLEGRREAACSVNEDSASNSSDAASRAFLRRKPRPRTGSLLMPAKPTASSPTCTDLRFAWLYKPFAWLTSF